MSNLIKFFTRVQEGHTATVLDALPLEFYSRSCDTTFIKVGGYNERHVSHGKLLGGNAGVTSSFLDDLSSCKIREVAGVRHCAIDRYNKAVYNGFINHYGALTGEGFHSLAVWGNPYECQPEDGKQYLLRPKRGARGVGFISLKPGGPSIAQIDKVLALTRCEGAGDFIKTLQGAGVQMAIQGLYPGEDVSKGNNDLANYDVVEYVPDVTSEYRIMTDYAGLPALVITRVRKMGTAGFEQACGAGQSPDQCIDFKSWAKSDDFKNTLTGFFRKCHRPVHSFDLYMTSSGTWGFFEASCEFGYTSLPNGWLNQQAQLLIERVAFETI